MQTPLSPLAGFGPVGEGTSGKVLNWTVRSLNHAYSTTFPRIKKKKLSSTILSLNEKKNPFHVPSTLVSAFMANNKILQKKNMNTQSAKMSQNSPFTPLFSKNFSGKSPQLQRDVSLTHHNAVSLRGWSSTPSCSGPS